MKHRAATIFAVLSVAAAAAPADGQEDRAQPNRPAVEQGAERPARGPLADAARDNPEFLRRFIARQIDRLTRQRDAFTDALGQLDRGEPIEEVREALREAAGPPAGDGPRGEGRAIDRHPWPGLFERRGPEDQEGGAPPHDAGRLPGAEDRAEELSGKRLDELIEFVGKNRPEMAERLRKLRRENPEGLRQFMRDKGGQILQLMKQQRDDPSLFEARGRLLEAERRSREAARVARRADGDAKEPAVAALREALAAQFDARAEVAKREIEGAKKWASRLEAQLNESISGRDAFLEERLQRALSGEELREPRRPGRSAEGGPGERTAKGRGPDQPAESPEPSLESPPDGDRGPRPEGRPRQPHRDSPMERPIGEPRPR